MSEISLQMIREKLGAFKRRRALAGAYRQVFGTSEGQMVLRDMMIRGGLLSVSHTTGDSHETAFNEGQRAHVLGTLENINWSERDLMELAAENHFEAVQTAADADS